jgi:chlorobactene glucosyltransferase
MSVSMVWEYCIAGALAFAWLALLMICLVTALNALTFPRLKAVGEGTPPGDVEISVLIPARNEAGVIQQTLRGLLGQNFPRSEILVLDDQSSDGTGQAAREAGEGDSRLRVIDGEALPGGWAGKNWACWQLAQEARGEVLVFTDADVTWKPGALAALVDLMGENGADLQTVWPTQVTVSWAERLVVPLMGFTTVGYLPLLAVHRTPWQVFAAANGQCLAFHKAAYFAIGGHALVRSTVLEDMRLARSIKRSRRRLRMADGNGLITCRMYRGWQEVRDGFAKNILAGHGSSVPFLLLSMMFHWLVFVFPWVWLGLGWLFKSGWKYSGLLWPWAPLVLVLMGVGARMLTAAVTRQRLRDAWLMPVSVVLMTIIAFQSIRWRWQHGGPQWKGRTLEGT